MHHGFLLLFFWGELFEHARSFSFEFTKNKVQKLIGKEFLYKASVMEELIITSISTYITISLIAELIKIFELSLALVELVKISLVKGDTSMSFVDLNHEVILNSLHGEVLSKRSELVVEVEIVGCFIFPFGLE